jgi:hypothetical protein
MCPASKLLRTATTPEIPDIVYPKDFSSISNTVFINTGNDDSLIELAKPVTTFVSSNSQTADTMEKIVACEEADAVADDGLISEDSSTDSSSEDESNPICDAERTFDIFEDDFIKGVEESVEVWDPDLDLMSIATSSFPGRNNDNAADNNDPAAAILAPK